VSWVGATDWEESLYLIKYGNVFWTGIIFEKDRKSGVEAISRPCKPDTEHWQCY
jgi:hypothetical protein